MARPTNAELRAKAQRWADRASAVYGIDAPEVLIVNDAPIGADGLGAINPVANTISLPKMSVISLFHFFRYLVQRDAEDVEILEAEFGGDRFVEDAAAFSTSLFHLVRPALFADAVNRPELTVCHVRPCDLDSGPVAA